MTKAFEERVKQEMIVDTKKYRYVYNVDAKSAVIKRIEINKLDTTAALTDWEVVKEWR